MTNYLKTLVIVLVLFSFSDSHAITYIWDSGAVDSFFQTPENWSPDGIPGGGASTTGDTVIIDPFTKSPTTNSLTNCAFQFFKLGLTPVTGDANMTMNGGTINLYRCYLGTGSGCHANLVINSGTFSCSKDIIVGNSGGWANVIVKDGIFRWKNGAGYTYVLDINGPDAAHKSHVQVDGGSLTGANLRIGQFGSLDMTGGSIVLSDNDLATVAEYVSTGKLTAFGGTGIINYSYNGTATTITPARCALMPQDLNKDCIIDFNDMTGLTSNWLVSDYNTYDSNAFLSAGFPTDNSQWVAGKFGNSLKLDGVDDWIDVNDTMIGYFHNRTISLWTKVDATPVTTSYIFGTTSNYRLYIRLNSEMTVDAQLVNAPVFGTTSISIGEWTHIGLVLRDTPDGNTIGEFYVNGSLSGTSIKIPRHAIGWLGGANIGSYGDGSNGFTNMSVDDFRIYNTALTQSQITDIYNNVTVSPLPLVWYKFDETSGITSKNYGTFSGPIYHLIPVPAGYDLIPDQIINLKDLAVMGQKWLN